MENQGRIGEQNEAYRKGLVLGLTMAEVAILIIFVLLLLLAFEEMGRVEVLERFHGREPIAELKRLQAREATLHQIATEMGATVEDSSENFTRLVRVVRDGMRSPAVRSAVSEAISALQDIKRAQKDIQRVVDSANGGGGDAVSRQVEQQGFRIANQEGQLKGLEQRLAAAGEGKGERPCWAQQGGTIDYLYDVVLTTNGIKMRERVYLTRERERALLPAPRTDPTAVLSAAVFLERTEPLFRHSQQNDCRFFVVVYDATATHEKPLYKSLLKTVEGHFYKRLDDGPAPF